MKISELAKICAEQTEQMNNASPEQKAKWVAEAEQVNAKVTISPEHEEAMRKLDGERWKRRPAPTPAHIEDAVRALRAELKSVPVRDATAEETAQHPTSHAWANSRGDRPPGGHRHRAD